MGQLASNAHQRPPSRGFARQIPPSLGSFAIGQTSQRSIPKSSLSLGCPTEHGNEESPDPSTHLKLKICRQRTNHSHCPNAIQSYQMDQINLPPTSPSSPQAIINLTTFPQPITPLTPLHSMLKKNLEPCRVKRSLTEHPDPARRSAATPARMDCWCAAGPPYTSLLPFCFTPAVGDGLGQLPRNDWSASLL